MILSKPPINAPFELSEKGLLISPVWILWLQSLVAANNVEDLVANSFLLQELPVSASMETVDDMSGDVLLLPPVNVPDFDTSDIETTILLNS